MHDTLARGVLEVSSETEQPHTIHLEKPEQNDPGDILMVVDNESTSWFHVAIMVPILTVRTPRRSAPRLSCIKTRRMILTYFTLCTTVSRRQSFFVCVALRGKTLRTFPVTQCTEKQIR
jgi:hypothetical protein